MTTAHLERAAAKIERDTNISLEEGWRRIAAHDALVAALATLADYAEAEARGDESVPMHLRCISAGQMAEAVIAARAALAAVKGQA